MSKNRTEWIESLQEISLIANSPVKQKNGIWEISDRKEAWKVLGPRVFDEHLDRFHRVVVEVLRERDPRIELDENERLTADLRGKQLKHSPVLRKGLADSLALLGSMPKALKSCSHGRAVVVAVLAVREILSGADWVLWASLNSYLPTLAEAAPDEFLDAVENAIAQNPCPFVQVFAQETSGIMGQNYITGLLWALETLAWSPEYLQRVTVILGELAALDPGGNWTNRPANSLAEIFLPWYPQTCASIPKRKAAVKALLKEQREVGWKLLISLLPQVHSSSSGCRKPVWRKFIPGDWSENVTNAEYWQQVTGYSELMVDIAAADSRKLVVLLGYLSSLPEPSFNRVLDHLKSEAITKLPESERLPIWEVLMELVVNHRRHPDAAWVMPGEIIARVEEVVAQIAPKDPYSLHHRLFSEQDYELFEDTENFDEQQKRLNQKRQAAVRELLELDGVAGVLDYVRQVARPGTVGLALGNIEWKEADVVLLPKFLDTEDKVLRDFVGNFVWGRYWSRGWAWAEDVIADKWTTDQKVALYAFFPFDFETWRRAEATLGKNSGVFWQRVHPQPYGPHQPHLVEAVEKFLLHERPLSALVCLNRLAHQKADFTPELAVRALMDGLKELPSGFNHHAVLELIQWLQDNPKTNPDDLFRVEWAYLPLLDHHFDRSPKVLEKRLAERPEFFCELISVVFRPEGEDRKKTEPTELEQKVATNAYRLLHNWRQPPGSTCGAAFDAQAFSEWLAEVKTKTKESGHFRIAMSQIGQVLAHTPPDPDGLWIHRSVADALDSKDVGDMRSGFTMKKFNLRGVHGFSAGKEELEFAERYHKDAEALEESGYHRFATAMRELAKGYGRDAEREAQRNPYGD